MNCCHTSDSVYRNLIYILIILSWLTVPFFTLFLFLFLFYKYKSISIVFLYFLISLSFALLAYTNKSTAESATGFDTDIVRYYDAVYPITYLGLSDALLLSFAAEGVYPVFVLANAVVVLLTGDVQIISFFWVFVIYFLFFLSINNYLKYRYVLPTRKQFFYLIIVCLLGFILFTQVTEVLKQAIATSIFMYGFTLLLLKRKIGYIFILLSFGVHAITYFLLLLLFYKKISKSALIVLLVLLSFFAVFNIMEFAASILPDTEGYIGILQRKAIGYSEDITGFSNSKRYTFLCIVYFLMLLYAQFKIKSPSIVLKIGYLYLGILLMNYSVPHNFVRLINMSHFFYAFFFIEILVDKRVSRKLRLSFLNILFFLFLYTNFTMTYGRTLGGGYTSSYMDNSITKIMLSSVPEFFKQKCY